MNHNEIIVNINNHPDIKVKKNTTILDILSGIDYDNQYPIVAATVNNNLCELTTSLIEDASINLLDITSDTGARIYRRTATFILIKAAYNIFPNRRIMIKHALSNGLYCEFMDRDTNPEEVNLIRQEMSNIIKDNIYINKLVLTKNEATNIFRKQGQDDKVALLELRDKEDIHVYELKGFYEYFYGYLAPGTNIVNDFDLFFYNDGLIMRTPGVRDPDFKKPYKEQTKLAAIFKEAKEWADMLETPHVAALDKKIINNEIDEIIQINEALHEKKIALIADEICADQDKRIILISGPSSSGKTTFAERLLIQLKVNGKKPISISMDNYFVDRELTPLDEEGNYNFEALEALKLELFNEHLISLLNGEEITMPIFNFHTGTTEPEGIRCGVPIGEPIIVEGIHALNDELTYSIPAKNKYRIYVSALTQLNVDYSNRIATTDCRLLRRLVRDSRTRGYSALETINRWPSVRRGEEINVFPFQENADIMVNTSLVYELAIIKPYAEKLLNEIGRKHPEYAEAQRLLKFLSFFKEANTDKIPPNSILREFIGGSWLNC